MEILFQITDHLFARIAICTKESMVVAYTIQTLPHILLRETTSFVSLGEELYGAFFGFDIFLYVAARTSFGIDFLCCGGYEVVP